MTYDPIFNDGIDIFASYFFRFEVVTIAAPGP